MSRYQMVCDAHGLTIEQGETLQKMILRTVFMQGWFGEEKEVELRMDNCVKLSHTGSEIAQKLIIAEIDDMAASD
jgi:hypothetical protein